jgi:hypothetical protein
MASKIDDIDNMYINSMPSPVFTSTIPINNKGYISPWHDLFSSKSSIFPFETNENIVKLTNQLEEKNDEIKKLREELKTKGKNDELLNEIRKKEEEQRKILELKYLFTRLHPIAPSILLEPDNKVLSDFSKNEAMEMTVMSIDIRKSTELMLKAITPDMYAEFISGLTEGLKSIVVNNFGVFDKFTGDGILAYFPTFYSGEEGILNCCIVSQKCHDFFKEFYKSYYDNFSVVLDTGLGIGIDHGMVKIVEINNEQTIVGASVVYACRLSGAPAGKTYLNRIAHKNITKYGITSKEIKMDIKNEGTIIVYELEKITEETISIPYWAKKGIK